MGDDRATRYIEDGTVVYRASGIGGCPRAIVLEANGVQGRPHPQWLLDIWEEGHDWEEAILTEASLTNLDSQQREVSLDLGVINGRRCIVRGHIDGIEHTLIPAVVEAKKFRDANWAKWRKLGLAGFDMYAWQVSCYMHALDMEAIILIGHLLDGDPPKLGDVHASVIDQPPYSLLDIRKRVKMIETAIAEDGWEEQKCTDVYPCPWFVYHDEGSRQPREQVSDGKLEILSKDVVFKDVLARQAKKELEEAKQVLKDALVSNGLEGARITVAGLDVTHVKTWVEEFVSTTGAHERNYVTVREHGSRKMAGNKRSKDGE